MTQPTEPVRYLITDTTWGRDQSVTSMWEALSDAKAEAADMGVGVSVWELKAVFDKNGNQVPVVSNGRGR